MEIKFSVHELNCIAGALYDVMMRDNEVHEEEKVYFNEFTTRYKLDKLDFMFIPRRERFSTLEQLTLKQKGFVANVVCAMARADGHFCNQEYDYIDRLFKIVLTLYYFCDQTSII